MSEWVHSHITGSSHLQISFSKAAKCSRPLSMARATTFALTPCQDLQ